MTSARDAVRRRVLRASMRGLVRPVLSASVPVWAQRRWAHALARFTSMTRVDRIEAATLGGVACERVWPAKRATRVVLYFHGGGYVVGSPFGVRSITTRLARNCGGMVVVPRYRLAPEHPYPAAVDDAIAVYEGLLAEGHEARSIAIGGDSAGGGLALATALRARALALPRPAAFLLFAPWVDLTLAHADAERARRDVTLDLGWLRACAQWYGGGESLARRELSPGLSRDLVGAPPMLIQVGGDDTLLAPQAEELAARARAAGVTCELETYPGMWHGFHVHAGALADSNEALDRAAAFLRRHVAETS